MDDKRCSVVSRRLLKVDDDNATSIWHTSQRHVASRSYAHARTHAKTQVRLAAFLETHLKNVSVEALSKVDDGVLECALASWSVTDATSLVVVTLVRCPDSVVSHVFSITFDADLKISITVYIG